MSRTARGRSIGWLEELHDALRLTRRQLLERPRFPLLVIAICAAVVAVNGIGFGLIDALLWRPLPVAEPDRLVHVYATEPGAPLAEAPMALPDALELGRRVGALSGVATWAWAPLAIDDGATIELAMGELVSGEYFPLLGVAPALGRALATDDDQAGAAPVAVLSHDTWLRRFGGSPAALSRALLVNGRRFAIVGVAPPNFRGLSPAVAPDLWLPLHTGSSLPSGVTIDLGGRTPGVERTEDRGRLWVWATARLRPGRSLGQARAEIDALARALAREHPRTNERRRFTTASAAEVRLLPGFDRPLRAGGVALLALLALVAAVAALDLASLFLARGLDRGGEIATRLALGASRARLVRQLAFEGIALALAGGLLGLGLAAIGHRLLARLPLPVDWPLDLALAPALSLRALAHTVGLIALSALLFALLPALAATRSDLGARLRGGANANAAVRPGFLRGLLLGGQVAAAVLLALGAGLALRAFERALAVDPGFDPTGVATITWAPELVATDRAAIAGRFDRLLEAARALPGVESAALASHLPLSGAVNFARAAAAGREPDDPDLWIATDAAAVGPGYFETLGIHLAAGRSFRERDRPGAAIVNETLARTLFPGEPAVGRSFRLAGVDGLLEVVGVAHDGKVRTLGEAPRPFVWRPLADDPRGTRTLAVRGRGDPIRRLPALRALAREIDPRVPVSRAATLDQVVGGALLGPRLASALFGVFATCALLLAALGIWGVVAQLASARQREIGIRLALGADRGDIARWLARSVLAPVVAGLAVGLVCGVAGGVAAGRAIGSALVRPDPIGIGGAVAAFAVAAATAALFPARRAGRRDPAAALRGE